MSMSNSKTLAYAPLIQAMNESLKSRWGVKVRVLSNPDRFKSAFYLLKKQFSDFESLSLLSTSTSSDFLIFHPDKGDHQDG